MAAADFDEPVLPETKKAKLTMDKKGEKRSYLKVYETLPSQLLNSYGVSAYVKQTDAEVWKQFSQRKTTGALGMTVCCLPEEAVPYQHPTRPTNRDEEIGCGP